MLDRLWYKHLPNDAQGLCGSAELSLHLAAHTASWMAELDNRPIGIALARFGQPDETTHKWSDLYDRFCAKAEKISSLDINAELTLCAEEKSLTTRNGQENYEFLELLAVNPDSQDF